MYSNERGTPKYAAAFSRAGREWKDLKKKNERDQATIIKIKKELFSKEFSLDEEIIFLKKRRQEESLDPGSEETLLLHSGQTLNRNVSRSEGFRN